MWYLVPDAARPVVDVVSDAAAALLPAGGHQRARGFVGIDIHEADMHAGKFPPAPHIESVMNHALAIGQMASVPAGKGTGNLDVLDSVIVAIAEREGDQGFRPQPAPSPGLR